MTDRVKGLTVVLDQAYRDDDVETIAKAIQMIKGVTRVDMVINDSSAYIAEQATKTEIMQKLYKFIDDNL